MAKTHESEAIDRLTAAVLALGVTIEYRAPAGAASRQTAVENVASRYEKAQYAVPGEGDG